MNKLRNENIAVTGIGSILPGVHDRSEFWKCISEGTPQVGKLTRFDGAVGGLNVYASAEIRDFDDERFLGDLPAKHREKYSREILIALSAMSQALADAGFKRKELPGARVSIIQSTSRGSLEWWNGALSGADVNAFLDRGALFRGLPSSAAPLAAIYLGAQGLVTTLTSACVGGNHAIGIAMDQLRLGHADVVLAGGHEFPILPGIANCYRTFGVDAGLLSQEQEDLPRSVKPYHRDRDGFVLGEGAVTLCLERESDARARGANILGLLFAHVPFNEAAHGTSMDLTGTVTAQVLERAIAAANHSIADVDFITGHGTATRTNDFAECQAVSALYSNTGSTPPLISNKAIFGHTFGVAGIINVAATVLSLHEQMIPCTANLTDVSPECDIDHVCEGTRASASDFALSLSFAFGSQTSVISVGKV